MLTSPAFAIRLAVPADIPALHLLIEQSIRGLQTRDYTPAQIEGALGHALGLDTQLIQDQTYFIANLQSANSLSQVANTKVADTKVANTIVADTITGAPEKLAGCGGWSFRQTLFGSDHGPGRIGAVMDPQNDAAKIRAIFVHPEFARRGLGTLILAHCEQAAQQAGFRRFEMGSTLTGLPLYTQRGYREIERTDVPLPNGEFLPIVRMAKSVR